MGSGVVSLEDRECLAIFLDLLVSMLPQQILEARSRHDLDSTVGQAVDDDLVAFDEPVGTRDRDCQTIPGAANLHEFHGLNTVSLRNYRCIRYFTARGRRVAPASFP